MLASGRDGGICTQPAPCRLDYLVVCDSEWQTLSGKAAGWVGDDEDQPADLLRAPINRGFRAAPSVG